MVTEVKLLKCPHCGAPLKGELSLLSNCKFCGAKLELVPGRSAIRSVVEEVLADERAAQEESSEGAGSASERSTTTEPSAGADGKNLRARRFLMLGLMLLISIIFGYTQWRSAQLRKDFPKDMVVVSERPEFQGARQLVRPFDICSISFSWKTPKMLSVKTCTKFMYGAAPHWDIVQVPDKFDDRRLNFELVRLSQAEPWTISVDQSRVPLKRYAAALDNLLPHLVTAIPKILEAARKVGR